jgi:hypothetical protein
MLPRRGSATFAPSAAGGRNFFRKNEAPVVLVKWYDYAKWLLERVENVLLSPPGQELVDYIVRLATAVSETEIEV